MEVDGGRRGLESSIHHPQRGLSDIPPGRRRAEPETNPGEKHIKEDPIRKAYRQVAELVSDGVAQQIWQIVKPLFGAEPTRKRVGPSTEAMIQEATKSIQTTIIETIRETVKKTPNNEGEHPEPTWAQIASDTNPTHTRTNNKLKPVPARHAREITIQTKDCQTNIRDRDPKDIVKAINTCGRTGPEAVAARKLRSGDVTITFHREIEQNAKNEEWIRAAFGPEAKLNRRQYVVVAKGIRATTIAQNTEALRKEIGQTNRVEIIKAKPMRKRNETAPRQNLILSVASPEEANTLCEQGIIIDAEISQCEPFYEAVQLRQCYNCYEIGHIARYCDKQARCGQCAAGAHPTGELCPVEAGGDTPTCILCKGPHPAWVRACPVLSREKEKTREAYSNRPIGFAIPKRNNLGPSSGHRVETAQQQQRTPSDPTAEPKRGPGRPAGTTNQRPKVITGTPRKARTIINTARGASIANAFNRIQNGNAPNPGSPLRQITTGSQPGPSQ